MANIKLEPDLMSAVSASADWKEVYQDMQTAIFVRNHPVNHPVGE
jgi:hypothetical protein